MTSYGRIFFLFSFLGLVGGWRSARPGFLPRFRFSLRLLPSGEARWVCWDGIEVALAQQSG